MAVTARGYLGAPSGRDHAVRNLRDAAARGESVTADGVREQAIGLLSEIAGALALSRAVLRADPNFSDEILRIAGDRLHTELRATPES